MPMDNAQTPQTREPPNNATELAKLASGVFIDGKPVAPEDDSSEVQPAESVAAQPAEEAQEAESSEDVAEEPAPAEESAETPEKPAKKTAKDRINELVREKHDLERARAADKAAWETRLAALEAKSAPVAADAGTAAPAVSAQVDAVPDPAKFEYGELDPKYIEAMIDHRAAKIAAEQISKAEAKRRADMEKTRADQAQAELRVAAERVRAEGVSKYKDFDEKMRSAVGGWADANNAVVELALQSDLGHDILYHLATHPTEAAEILRKAPLEQARYVGRLEAQFTSKPKAQVKVPNAPPPPKFAARGASGTNETAGAATTDFRAFEALANSRR